MSKTASELLNEFTMQPGVPRFQDFKQEQDFLFNDVNIIKDLFNFIKGDNEYTEAQKNSLSDIFNQSMMEKDFATAKECIEYGATPQKDMYNAFYIAIKNNDLENVKFLINVCNFDLNPKYWCTTYTFSPLQEAAFWGSLETFKYLLSRGAKDHDMTVNNFAASFNSNALFYATTNSLTKNPNVNQEGCRKIVKFLITEEGLTLPRVFSDTGISEECYTLFKQELEAEIEFEKEEKALGINLDDLRQQTVAQVDEDEDWGASAGGPGHAIRSDLSGEGAHTDSDFE